MGHKHKNNDQHVYCYWCAKLVLQLAHTFSLFRYCLLGLQIRGETCFPVVLFRNACLAVAERPIVSGIVVHDARPDCENLMLLLKLRYHQRLLDGHGAEKERLRNLTSTVY